MTIEETLELMQGVVSTAEDEKRSMTDEEVTKYEELEAVLKGKQKTAELISRQAAYNTPSAPAPLATGTQTEDDDTIDRAFEHYLTTGQENSDIFELRSQNVGSDAAGGYTVPEGFRTKLVEEMKAFGGIANVVENITTATGGPLEFPTLSDVNNLGERVPEGFSFSEAGADLVFGTKTVPVYKYAVGGTNSRPLRISMELLQDSAFDVAGKVASALGTRIARLQSVDLVTGDGSAKPEGIINGLTGEEIADDTAGITYDDLITFIHSLDPAYRTSARWAFNDRSLETIRKIKDSAGYPIWRPDTADMATGLGGGVLLGYPVTIDQAFPDFTADDNTVNWGVFGDTMKGYLKRNVMDITVMVNPYTRQSNGEVEYTAWARMGGIIQDPNAYIALTGEAV